MFFRRNSCFKNEGNFLLAKVRTDRHGEVIPVRLSKTSEMSNMGRGYFVRKVLIGSKSLDEATLEVTLTRGHRVKSATVEGGMLLPVKEWED
jgi:hypothetical protein